MGDVVREVLHAGEPIGFELHTFARGDGRTVARPVVTHPGAVAVVAHDDRSVWLVRQPREAVGEPALLELPGGKLDRPGETPLEAARRELAEEAGVTAGRWEAAGDFYVSPGYSRERVFLFFATELAAVERPPAPDSEAVVPEAHPLDALDDLIAGCREASTLVGLLRLRLRR